MSRAIAYAALAIAGGALALSIHTAVRDRHGAAPSAVCVDADARAELAQLKRTTAIRDASARRAASAGAGAAASPEELVDAVVDAGASGGGSGDAGAPAGPRRYTRFEIPDPAVTVTQRDDGVIEVHSRDPALAGSVLTITAVTAAGERDQMMIRVP